MSLIIMTLLLHINAHGEIRGEVVEYKAGNQILEGYVAYDAKSAAKRPGIVIVPDWMGVSTFAKKQADELATMGYTAFVADIYGKGVRPSNAKEAGLTSGLYKKNRKLLREHVRAAYNELLSHKTVDRHHLAAIGFCFGGMTALELARSGAPLAGVISFHGNLDSPTPSDSKNIKGPLLILHGADDPFVPPTQVAEFEKEMKIGNVKYELIKYPGAVHAFTNPEADKKSKLAMIQFFNEIFKKR